MLGLPSSHYLTRGPSIFKYSPQGKEINKGLSARQLILQGVIRFRVNFPLQWLGVSSSPRIQGSYRKENQMLNTYLYIYMYAVYGACV